MLARWGQILRIGFGFGLLLTAGCRHEEKITAPGYYNGPMQGRHVTRQAPRRSPSGKLDMDS